MRCVSLGSFGRWVGVVGWITLVSVSSGVGVFGCSDEMVATIRPKIGESVSGSNVRGSTGGKSLGLYSFFYCLYIPAIPIIDTKNDEEHYDGWSGQENDEGNECRGCLSPLNDTSIVLGMTAKVVHDEKSIFANAQVVHCAHGEVAKS